MAVLSHSDRESLSAALDLMCGKLLADEGSIGVDFPYVTGPEGQWLTMPASRSAGYEGDAWSHGNWFCGFWVGLLAAGYLHSSNPRLLDLARSRMDLVARRAEDPNTHDIGFIFWSSAVPLHRITGESRYAEMAIAAAQKLRARTVATQAGAYVSSWGPLDDPRGRASSAIDTMANIPLLYWAAEFSGDASFRLSAQAHADHTARAFIRPDDTLYHAVEYDVVTGERLRGYTFQGYGDESNWSRGTGWALIGYAATAVRTRRIRDIEIAVRLGERWLQLLGDRICPPWDFDDPSPRPEEDSSAAAIAAAGMLDIGAIHPDPAERERWTGRGIKLVTGLARDYLAREPQHRGLLKHGCYSKPHGIGTDSAVMFGDYYFVEAIARVLMPDRFLPRLSPIR